MIPAAFDYAAPESAGAALEALRSHDNAVLLAGGHTLLTALKQRQSRPGLVVDLRNAGLGRLEVDGVGDLVIGARVTQQYLADFCAREGWPVLAEIGEKAGDPMIRARGTFVGALCAAEPGGDWAAGALALGAMVRVLSGEGEKTLDYADYLERKAEPHIVLEASIPAKLRAAPQGYTKVKHAAIGWSVASLAHVETEDGPRLAASGALERPRRLEAVEQVATASKVPDLPAIDDALSALTFTGDRYAPADWRRRRLALLVRDHLHTQSAKEPT
ncbi:MAG: FAD binding domain-containing protein [Pseudomonadota bacterium]